MIRSLFSVISYQIRSFYFFNHRFVEVAFELEYRLFALENLWLRMTIVETAIDDVVDIIVERTYCTSWS